MRRRTQADIIEKLARERGILRPRDLAEHGISRAVLSRMCEKGVLVRVGRGLYELADLEPSEHHALAEAQRKVPAGIVCLLSALVYHELTTQIPFEVWMAIDRKAMLPRVEHPSIRFVRFSGQALTFGVQKHLVEGVTVRITSPAKTVADCFKYRNKIGMDVALEALRDYRASKAGTIDELWRAAEVCRVANVMRPYLEAMA